MSLTCWQGRRRHWVGKYTTGNIVNGLTRLLDSSASAITVQIKDASSEAGLLIGNEQGAWPGRARQRALSGQAG